MRMILMGYRLRGRLRVTDGVLSVHMGVLHRMRGTRTGEGRGDATNYSQRKMEQEKIAVGEGGRAGWGRQGCKTLPQPHSGSMRR